MSLILAIDPGLSGAVALVEDGALRAVFDMPVMGAAGKRFVNGAMLAHLIRKSGTPDIAIIEDVHAMPGQGVVSMFTFGESKGVARGVVAALGIPERMVRPAVWKKDMGLGTDKEKARMLAIGRWPGCAEHFARKKDHGRAEAALLAIWGQLDAP